MTQLAIATRPTVRQISAHNVSFCYAHGGRQILSDICFTAKAANLVAIVGPNGCGKSTLLRILIGELRPSAGHWNIDNTPAHEIPRSTAARYLALVPQLASAPFGYTVQEIVLMARHAAHAQNSLMPLGFETRDDLDLAQKSMWAADVHHLADRPINELSGGERQRVAIARAFAQDTPIVLLDEPTSNLDLFHQLELLHHLREMTKQESRIALLVTHDLNLAAEYADQVILMDNGQIIAAGPPKEILTPEHLEPVYHVKVQTTPTGQLHFTRPT
jgi:iron complex transport system ATP-binding protein